MFFMCSLISLLLLSQSSSLSDAAPAIDLIYERIGSKELGDLVDIEQVLDASPSTKKLIEDNVNRFLNGIELRNVVKADT